MISYASVDRIEGEFVVCEVELLEISQSKPEDFAKKDTVMADIPMEMVTWVVEDVQEGDILLVEHEDGNVTDVYSKDDDEKQRRIEQIKRLQV